MKGNVMLQLQLTMFLMLAVGYICTKRKMFTTTAREGLVNVFISVMIPCSIISAFLENLTVDILIKGVWMILAYTFNLSFCWAIGKVLYKRMTPDKQGILKYATIISNAQFMGFPIVQAAVGDAGLMLASLAMIPGTVFTWTIALAQFTKIDGKQGVKSVFTHPCFWSVIIGVLLAVLRIPLPYFVKDSLERLGNCVMPVSMLIIGSILAGINPNAIFDWKLYYYSAVRLIGIPLVLYLVFTLVHLDPMVKNVVVIMAAMPAGTVTAMLAEKHGADAEFASQLIFVSTLLSIVTLSVLSAIL